MAYKERVKYYIEECHLDRYDAEREALDDMRECERERELKASDRRTKNAMIGILKELRTIVDILPNDELRKVYKHFDNINEHMKVLIDEW